MISLPGFDERVIVASQNVLGSATSSIFLRELEKYWYYLFKHVVELTGEAIKSRIYLC